VEAVAKRASLLLLLVVVFVGAVVLGARWVARHQQQLRAVVNRFVEQPRVAGLRRRYRRQLDFLVRRLRPEGAAGLSLTVSFLLLAGAGWALGAVTQDVIAGDDAARVDLPVLRFFVRHREPWLTSVGNGVT